MTIYPTRTGLSWGKRGERDEWCVRMWNLHPSTSPYLSLTSTSYHFQRTCAITHTQALAMASMKSFVFPTRAKGPDPLPRGHTREPGRRGRGQGPARSMSTDVPSASSRERTHKTRPSYGMHTCWISKTSFVLISFKQKLHVAISRESAHWSVSNEHHPLSRRP
jgi:hypothetical protein